MKKVLESKLEADILNILPTYECYNDLNVPEKCEGFVQSQINCNDLLICNMKEKGYRINELIFMARNNSQIRLGMGKKCDILGSWYKMYSFEKNGVYHDVEEKVCNIYEIKVGAIDHKAIEQILRYKEAISKLGYYDEIRLILIGDSVGDIYNVLKNIKVNIELYTYEYINGELSLTWIDQSNFIDNSIGFCNKFLVAEMLSYSKRSKEYDDDEMTLESFLQQGYVQRDLYTHSIK